MEEKAEPTKEYFRCGRIGHIRADCRAKTYLNGGLPKPAPKGKEVGSCEEEQETSQNVPLVTTDLGSFEVLSDHGDTEDDSEESSFFDEQSDSPWARNAPKSISSARGCTSVNFPVCSVCHKLGCVQPTVANYSSLMKDFVVDTSVIFRY